MVSLEAVCKLIARHEGFRGVAYKDTKGNLTIGYGTNLDGLGAAEQCRLAGVDYESARAGDAITPMQAGYLLKSAATHAMGCARVRVNGFDEMPDNVQLAIVDMIYNLGFSGFSAFRKFIAAVEERRWSDAVQEMRCSAWYHQVGQRAIDDMDLVGSACEVSAND